MQVFTVGFCDDAELPCVLAAGGRDGKLAVRVSVCVRARVRVCVCVRARSRVCVRACECVCARESGRACVSVRV